MSPAQAAKTLGSIKSLPQKTPKHQLFARDEIYLLVMRWFDNYPAGNVASELPLEFRAFV